MVSINTYFKTYKSNLQAVYVTVYACLVCGKYFQGRGNNTHAYTHSVGESHHVFLNLLSLRFYCLPDNYEIIDSSLDVSAHYYLISAA